MSLAAITDRAAVEAAIEEFDSVGRDAFLRKYGFGPARSYHLLYHGRRYDSKAIVGAAHAYQFPKLGSLSADSFSGGEATVAKKLRSLGFEVSSVQFGERPPAIWAFCANPKRYRIRDAVQHVEIDYWTVGHSDVRAGDHGVIWQTLDSEGNRGIIAFAEILGDPEPRTDEANAYWVDPREGSERIPRVPVSYGVPEGLPLWVDESQTGAFLKSLSVARAQGGTVFKLRPEEWRHLMEMVNYKGISVAEIEAREQLRHRSSSRSGQGFGLNNAERKAVEEHAMRIALACFKREWDSVKDVSATSSYDLLCQRGSEILRVEVKGTTTTGQQIVLTRNEVNEAHSSGYALFIVSGVVLDRSKPQKPSASGGTARLFSPWTPSQNALEPISFICDIDVSQGIVISSPDKL